jgi:histone H3/H4
MAAAKKKTTAKQPAKKAREIVVVGSKVKDVIRSAGYRSDGELVQALSDKVHEVLEAAIKRAESNKRGTVRPYDL